MIPQERFADVYEKMVRIRSVEEKAAELFLKGVLPGFLHSSIGQEAVSVGACTALRDDDYMISTHRGHGDIIAKGARTDRMMAELFARKTGYCKGKGGSMHIADLDLGIRGNSRKSWIWLFSEMYRGNDDEQSGDFIQSQQDPARVGQSNGNDKRGRSRSF